MKTLKPDWIIEGRIDFEYKKYILLAYLQEASKSFQENRLYPFLADLIFHHQNIQSLKEQTEEVIRQFPKRISRIDLQDFQLEYERMMEDDSCMEEIKTIVDFAIPRIREQMNEGQEIYDFIESNMEIQPIGVQPLQYAEGYCLLRKSGSHETLVYLYQTTLFESAKESYRGLKTQFIRSYRKSLRHTWEFIKSDLISSFRQIPNPAVYGIEANMDFPFQESLLPIAKRLLIRTISQQAA